jgi:hypothetical protein
VPRRLAVAPQPALRPDCGRVHDLPTIYSELNDRYFAGRLNASIGWGRNAHVRRRRQEITLGCYVVEDRKIRIHRALDRAFIPRWFVAWVVYHEMLHAFLGVEEKNGRQYAHTRTFRELELLFHDHERAAEWERRNLWRLLNY